MDRQWCHQYFDTHVNLSSCHRRPKPDCSSHVFRSEIGTHFVIIKDGTKILSSVSYVMGNPILEINPNTRLDSQKIASFFLYGFQSDFGKVLSRPEYLQPLSSRLADTLPGAVRRSGRAPAARRGARTAAPPPLLR